MSDALQPFLVFPDHTKHRAILPHANIYKDVNLHPSWLLVEGQKVIFGTQVRYLTLLYHAATHKCLIPVFCYGSLSEVFLEK